MKVLPENFKPPTYGDCLCCQKPVTEIYGRYEEGNVCSRACYLEWEYKPESQRKEKKRE